jgi:hypothetical protein
MTQLRKQIERRRFTRHRLRNDAPGNSGQRDTVP